MTTCAICHGVKWLRRWVGNDTEAYPCPCQNPAGEQARRLLRYSELPHENAPRTFENFEYRSATVAALEAAQKFADGECGYNILVLTGFFGSGKSHLLEAIGRQTVAQGVKVKYTLVADMLDRFRDSYDAEADTQFREIYAGYEKAELLLLDDLGAERPTEWAAEKLTRLIDDRYRNGKRLAVATNLGHKAMIAKLGERIADRLFDSRTGVVKTVIITAPSYRQAAHA